MATHDPGPLNIPSDIPLSNGAFDALMAGFAPFEPNPVVTVGVSGGADSLALMLLADAWARRRGGSAIGLTIDHGLRPESGREARMVAGRLKQRGIAHHVLRWRGDKPRTGVEAAAREARYDLLTGWCRRRGVLHLLLAHHMEDQAETFLMRLARNSGPDGLAAMAGIVEFPDLRIVRPLLATPRAQLRQFLESAGQEWIEDPSNRDTAHTRVRIRNALPMLEREGLARRDIAAAAAGLGRTRAAMERETARLTAKAIDIYPMGYCRIRPAALHNAAPEFALRALTAAVTCIGGGRYPPRGDRMLRLHEAVAGGRLVRPRTLGGCLIAPRRGLIYVTREPGATAGPQALTPGRPGTWDGRFRVTARHRRGNKVDFARAVVGPLGEEGLAAISDRLPALKKAGIPRAALITLPAIRRGGKLIYVPHFPQTALTVGIPQISVDFSPAYALTRPMFSVV